MNDINESVILFQKKAQEAHSLLEKLGPKVELVSPTHISAFNRVIADDIHQIFWLKIRISVLSFKVTSLTGSK
jgi:hypothetical protein